MEHNYTFFQFTKNPLNTNTEAEIVKKVRTLSLGNFLQVLQLLLKATVQFERCFRLMEHISVTS